MILLMPIHQYMGQEAEAEKATSAVLVVLKPRCFTLYIHFMTVYHFT